MSELLVHILAAGLLIGGGIFGVLGALGLLRFPDFYTRAHAAGMTDTLCALMIITGLILLTGWSLLTLKLALILLFLLFTSPTAAHALAKAALTDGVVPIQKEPTHKAATTKDSGGSSSNT